MRLLGLLAAAAVLATTPAAYLQSQQQPDGGWGSPQMTSWAALGLRAAGADTGGALGYLVAHAVGNVALALAVGPELRRLLERYGRRLHAEVVWA
jgi:hypothetical protein